MVPLFCAVLLALAPAALATPVLQTTFLPTATGIDLAANTVTLPLHRAVLPNGTSVYYVVTEASTAEAAKEWGVNHAPALAATSSTAAVQKVLSVSASTPTAMMLAASTGRRSLLAPNSSATANSSMMGLITPGSVLELPATVDFEHGKRSVVPNPDTGFPPANFSYSAQGNPGYNPLVQLPDGTILNAPHVAVQRPNGSLATHPKVLSVAPNKRSVVFALTPGFSQGQAIVYISTEASDPLAATLENVPYVAALADIPKAALIDLVAFTNGQRGANNPQRQGLNSAILDGLSPLNIAANTPASPAYSPLWAVNLAKWVGPPGDRQSSTSDVSVLSAAGKVASFNPNDPASNALLAPSGIVVNCPIIATVAEPPVLQTTFLPTATGIDLAANTVTLPLHRAVLPNGTSVYYVVTEASTAEAAKEWGVNHAPALAATSSTAAVQKVLSVSASTPTAMMLAASTGRRSLLAPNASATANSSMMGLITPGSVLELPATVDFEHGKRSVVPNPDTGFPPANFSYSAQGNPGYSPLVQLPNGTILNAPHVAVQRPNGSLATHPKVLSVAPNKRSVVFALTPGFSQGQAIVYISTEASDPLAATLENVPYVAALADIPKAALIDLVAFTNGQRGANNPQRQGLNSAILDGLSPLNIAANTPASPAYSPLWAVNLAKWVGPPGDRQTSTSDVSVLSAAGTVASFNPNDPAANAPLAPSGIVVNCPIIATVAEPDSAMLTASAGSGCTPSNLGYSCVIEPDQGVKIHYSLGGKPPANACTSTSKSSAQAGGPDSPDSPEVAHFAVEANTPGFVAMSFPQTKGRMWPADAVIGYTDGSSGAPNVNSYHLNSYSPGAADATQGWAQGTGIVNQNGNKLLCFSRALDSPQAAVVRTINPAAPLPINWALGDQNALVMHTRSGSLDLGLADGSSSITGDSSTNQTAFRIAHGALMLAAFILLMPAAVLMARHKWLFGNKLSGKVSTGWFKLHQLANVTAVVLALTAVILIFVRFQWTGRADTATYYTAHRAVGMTAIAMMLVQGLLGGVRPSLGSAVRPKWRRLHQAWGWLTLLMGTAASYMGMSLIHDLSGIPLAYWLGPALAVTGLLLVGGMLLEFRKRKLERSGNYDKNTHTVAPSVESGADKDMVPPSVTAQV